MCHFTLAMHQEGLSSDERVVLAIAKFRVVKIYRNQGIGKILHSAPHN